ncbi:hypothetical protein SAMN02745166_03863 [Prosthecobacter debontii]|uniref:Uncharacterized protein n=1 Tax=Prosthecobacter debontii TaxID=48467 RepID=A0A1T4YPH6_9BACT|nr:hypothetical protein SAMN02745166_03863 [Prosthecobacter debontii]
MLTGRTIVPSFPKFGALPLGGINGSSPQAHMHDSSLPAEAGAPSLPVTAILLDRTAYSNSGGTLPYVHGAPKTGALGNSGAGAGVISLLRAIPVSAIWRPAVISRLL